VLEDLAAPSRGAHTQSLARQPDAYDQFDLGWFAMANRAMGLQNVALARSARALAPGPPLGMPVGAQIAKPQPPVITTGLRTQGHGGVDLRGASGRQRQRIGSHQRHWEGLRRFCSQRHRRLLGEASNGLGSWGAWALRCEGLGLGRCDRSAHTWLGPVRWNMMKSQMSANRTS